MNAASLSIRAWVGLLFLLYVLCELNGIRFGMDLVRAAPNSPTAATGQTVAMLVGSRGAPATIYVTSHEQFVYYLWLGGGMAALMAGLALMVGYGVTLALRERRARVARTASPARRKPLRPGPKNRHTDF
jgi:hypothetical protein